MTHQNANTFADFVVSKSSHVAFSAAMDVAENPDCSHNPLFLYGPTGSGKSHLLHAIAHAMRTRQRNVLHVAAETFVARFIDAIRSDEVGAFRHSIAAVDALLLDDLPHALDKQHTREGIFRELEELLTHGVQVVIASEMPPAEIKIMEQRSRPLFERALVAEIGYPDGPARVEIARRAAKMRGVVLSDDALRFLANRLTGNPREIQSSIVRIAAESVLSGSA
jgi:chromosomal replication initiator protein